jgi:hypothetical protein
VVGEVDGFGEQPPGLKASAGGDYRCGGQGEGVGDCVGVVQVGGELSALVVAGACDVDVDPQAGDGVAVRCGASSSGALGAGRCPEPDATGRFEVG